MKQQNSISYMREKEVLHTTKLSKSTRWRLEKEGKFPRRRQLSPHTVGWLESEINEWLLSRSTVDGEI